MTIGDLLIAVVSRVGTSAVASPGWTALPLVVEGTVSQAVLWRIATGAEDPSYTYSWTTHADTAAVVAAYSGVDQVSPFAATASMPAPAGTTITAPGVTTDAPVIVSAFGIGARTTISTPAETDSRAISEDAGDVISATLRLVDAPHGGGASAARIATAGQSARNIGTTLALRLGNQPPNAPIVSDQGPFHRAVTNRVPWQFSDPDPGDTQSAAQVRYRVEGTSTWLPTVSVPNPNQFWDSPAGTWVADSYEAQVRTADQAGEWGPWSASFFITAGDAPEGATILSPTAGATIGTDSAAVTISAADVDEAEYRLYADDAGAMGETQLQPAQVKATGNVRTATWSGLENGVPVWLWVRIKRGGLWSEPVTQRNPVSYTPPPSPSFTIGADPQTGSLLISVTNPAPSGTEPQVAYNRIEVDDADGRGWGTRHGSAMVARNGLWRYWLARSGVDYRERVRVVAVGENGTSSTTTGAS